MVGCVFVCVHVCRGGLLFAPHALSPVTWLISFQRDSEIILAILIICSHKGRNHLGLIKSFYS